MVTATTRIQVESAPGRSGYVPLLCAGFALACGALYRLVVFASFSNDQSMHLAWAQQIVRGELPGRDFVEPGMPLTIALSAAAQGLMGNWLLAELVLCVTFIAAAAGLTCWLGVRLTGSPFLGVTAAALQVAIYPRLYNYPKLFVPLVAVLLIWRYIERPTVARSAVVGVWVATGFLFRHDYVLYLGVAALAAMAAVLPRCGRRETAVHLGACAAAAIMFVLPYLIALQFLGGVAAHFRDGVEFARAEQYQWSAALPRFALAPQSSGPSRADLGPAGPVRRMARAAVLDGVLRAAPVVSRHNSDVVLYYGAFMLPAALIGALGIAALRRHPRAWQAHEAQALALAVLSLALALGFIRHPFQARLPDVAGTMPLIAVVIAAAMRHRGGRLRLGAAVLLGVALLAVVVEGNVWNRLYATGVISAPRTAVSRVETQWAALHTWPWERFWPQGPLAPSVRYLHQCTAPDDRILVTWFAPEIFTFADRGFAAGHAFFTRTHFVSPDYQAAMLERLSRQRVPVALINLEQRSWFSTRFSGIDAYLNEVYAVAGTYRNYDGADIAVAVRRDLKPSGVFVPTGWPCFR